MKVSKLDIAPEISAFIYDKPVSSAQRHRPITVILQTVGPAGLFLKMAQTLSASGLDIASLSSPPDVPPADMATLVEHLLADDPRRGVVLVGLCDHAIVALQLACVVPGIVGAVLIDPYPGELDLIKWQVLGRYRHPGEVWKLLRHRLFRQPYVGNQLDVLRRIPAMLKNWLLVRRPQHSATPSTRKTLCEDLETARNKNSRILFLLSSDPRNHCRAFINDISRRDRTLFVPGSTLALRLYETPAGSEFRYIYNTQVQRNIIDCTRDWLLLDTT